ncbi:MAG: hypothetical protein H7263_16485, partial [Candidatus Sericytochromatia bacterium]|nr:hypothetical protein [Candidatus Sericytochromatia bacterium]
MIKFLKKAITVSIICTTSLVLLSGSYSDPIFDPNYYFRALSFPFSEPIKQYKWYTPKVKVNGDNKDLEISKSGESEISKEAINQVIEYAKQHNSLGFMVVHHGKIVTENYFNGWNNQ